MLSGSYYHMCTHRLDVIPLVPGETLYDNIMDGLKKVVKL
jgi:hypothetical protein